VLISINFTYKVKCFYHIFFTNLITSSNMGDMTKFTIIV